MNCSDGEKSPDPVYPLRPLEIRSLRALLHKPTFLSSFRDIGYNAKWWHRTIFVFRTMSQAYLVPHMIIRPKLKLFWCQGCRVVLRDGSLYQIGWIFGKVPKGGEVIFNPKIHIADFEPLKRFFGHCLKKLQYNFPKKRGGGSKAVWNFSENSSDLVAWPVPKWFKCFYWFP